MVDFLKVKVNRLSDSVVLQHLWNSIDDLVLCEVQPSKTNVIDRCKNTYGVETDEINKNLFLALKEGTISRNVKTDVLSRIELKDDKVDGDWYCFLCHKVGPDTRCRKCGTSFHNKCNRDLSDQFHCHMCQSKTQFSTDFQKFTSTTQLRIIRRVIYANKIKWHGLNIVGYIKDNSRNNFFIYKIINAIEIDKRLSLGKYFSSEKGRENFLFDLLLLRHNCAVIYGNEHEFSKTITGYIKHLNTEIENIYCESCFLLFSKMSSQKLSSSQKQELFCSVCAVRHQVMWGLVPPNVFWPFKLISEDNERYYGIKFSKSIHFNRQKLESFSKEISLIWSSYNLQMCDRPSAELLRGVALAQAYAQNLFEAQKLSNTMNGSSNIRLKKESKQKPKISKASKMHDDEMTIPKRKIGRPVKAKVGRPPSKKKQIIRQQIDQKTFIDNLSSTESSSESVHNSCVNIQNPVKRKRIKDVFISDNEKPSKMIKSIVKSKCHSKRKRRPEKTFQSISSTESESNCDNQKYDDSEIEEDVRPVSRLDYRTYQQVQSSSSSCSAVSHSSPKSRNTNRRGIARFLASQKKKRRNDDMYSSDDTIPQRISNLSKIYSSEESVSESDDVLSPNDIKCKKMLTHRRSHCNFATSSKYSAYSSSASHSYNCTPDDYSKEHSKNLYNESSQNSLPSSGKDMVLAQGRNGNLETGLYCSSSSPVNFSPISNNHQTNVAQVSVQSTPSSHYQMSCDEATYQSGGNLNMKIVLKNRAFQMSSPLQLGINIDPKIRDKSQSEINPKTAKRNEISTASKNAMTDYSESDY